MMNEEIIDHILYERLAPVIDSFDYRSIEDDSKLIEQTRDLYNVWLKEIVDRLYCLDYFQDHPNNSIEECDKMLLTEIGRIITCRNLNKHALVEMLGQMKICMLKDKDNPFFKLRRTRHKIQDIEQDFR